MGLLETISTPERREQAKREQEELREKFGHRLAQHPAQANYLYGMAREQQALDQLQAIQDGRLTNTDERTKALYNQVAEALALQARFEEAATITESEPHRAEYLAKAAALTNVGVGCQCPTTMTTPSPHDAKGVTSPARQRVQEVFDGRAIVTLTKCLICGAFAAQIG